MTPYSPIVARPELARVPRAVHGGPGADGSSARITLPPLRVDFSTSVNAYGPAPAVLAAVRASLDAGGAAAYPDPTCAAARAAIAARAGVTADAVAVGAGATELILAVALAYLRPGDRMLVPPRGFAEYARAAQLCGARVTAPAPIDGDPAEAALDATLRSYVAAVVAEAPRVAVLCTPESPGGRAWPLAAVREVAEACRRAGTLLLLDQSFDPFAAEPLGTPAIPEHPSTLHLRSLTKDHALAGLRIGYLIGPPALVASVEGARMPWMVSAPAQAAAVAACSAEAESHVRETTQRLRHAAAVIADGARRIGVVGPPSDVHYLLLDVGSAATVARTLREQHALQVRDCTSFGLPSHIRVAARTDEENHLLLAALGAVRAATGDDASSSR